MPELLPLFLAGLLGGAHCAGMCGGLVAAFAGAQAKPADGDVMLSGARAKPADGILATTSGVATAALRRASPVAGGLALHLAFNGGRLASYALAGAIAGTVGFAGVGLATQVPLRLVLLFVANLMLLAMALYLMGVPQLLLPLERQGARLWRRLQPLSARWLPVQSWRQALPLGLLWGWLPCGLVYSALATALAAGTPQHGAAAMLAFGAGTLPNLLVAGLAATRLRRWTARRGVRVGAGLIVMALAVNGLWSALRLAAN